MSRTALVLAGGDTPTTQVQSALPPAAMCIAADSGLDHARALGIVPDLAVGDFDSASAEGLAWARENEVDLETHPPEKDSTDLELALDRAVGLRADRVVVAAIGGGRFDHLLANIALLAQPRYADVEIEALVGTSRVSIVHDHRTLTGRLGETISLVPTHGPAEGVRTTGLRYPLRGEPLPPGTSRGVSNEFAATTASVTLTAGTLVVVQPYALGPLPDDEAGPGPGGR